MEKKHITAGWVIGLAVLCALAYKPARWGLYTMAVRETVQKVERLAAPERMLEVRPELQRAAERYHLDPATLTIEVAFKERSEGPVSMWFLAATVSDDAGRTFSNEKHIETSVNDDVLACLRDGGVVVRPLQ